MSVSVRYRPVDVRYATPLQWRIHCVRPKLRNFFLNTFCQTNTNHSCSILATARIKRPHRTCVCACVVQPIGKAAAGLGGLSCNFCALDVVQHPKRGFSSTVLAQCCSRQQRSARSQLSSNQQLVEFTTAADHGRKPQAMVGVARCWCQRSGERVADDRQA